MTGSASTAARAAAAIALVAGFVLVIFTIATSFGGGGGDGSAERPAAERQGQGGNRGQGRPADRFYVVQNGDTLTSIAQEKGVSVSRLQRLNPGVDPQILVSGQKLKLR